jgi:thermostable 8-oxoguanine DNA glycosylase
MLKNGLIDEIPNTLNKEKYLEIEKKFGLLAKSLCLSLGELDLYCWYIEKGKVLK